MFLTNKKIVFAEKRYRIKFNRKDSCKKFKNTKTYLYETMLENQEQQK